MTDTSDRGDLIRLEDLKRTLDEKDKLIKRQFIRIEDLENEIALLKQEKEAFLCDINKLRFELEMSELKRQKESRLALRGVFDELPPLLPPTEDVFSISSSHSSERASAACHPPPYKQNRSCGGLESRNSRGPPPPNGKKTPIRRLDEEALKRSRILNSQYELSQDLLDKQVEMLERKYGGVRARHAALTIQRAFRKYCMMKRFRDIANASKGERRLSRRLFSQEGSILFNGGSGVISEGAAAASQSYMFRELGESRTVVSTRSEAKHHLEIKISKTTVTKEASSLCDHHLLHNGHYSPKLRPSVLTHCHWTASPPPLRTPNSPSSPPHLLSPVITRDSISSEDSSSACGDGENVPPPPVRIPSSKPEAKKPRLPHKSTNWSDSNLEVEPRTSPVWGRKNLQSESLPLEDKRLSNISENSEDSLESSSGMSEVLRKRQYRVGLNLFNKKPERGVRYLIQRGFLESSPQAVARFLVSRKGLSRQMVGEYLGNLQSAFNMAVLQYFVQEIDLAGMQVDVALRKFQTYFRMPGEAQKIERLVEVFSQRYVECNRDIVAKLHSPDTVFVLAFATIMLNTDLHTPSLKADKRMKLDEFVRNLRGVDDSHDMDRAMLAGIYDRIKASEFRPGSDHVTQVLKVQQSIVGKKPNLGLPHRRLVCYCRLYEVYDINKKERPGLHQREVFLFNDMLMVTKIFNKKKMNTTYTFRQSFPLSGLAASLFENQYYPHGIQLSQRVDGKVLIRFNARNEHDRSKFVEDLKESIMEMDEMENLRIEGELEKQKMGRGSGGRSGTENRDSGVADMEVVAPVPSSSNKLSPDSNLKRSAALSNSLLDLHDNQLGKTPVRRGSAGSLDSGMSVSFQSSAASTVSHESSPHGETSAAATAKANPAPSQPGFLGGLFGKKTKSLGKTHM